MMASPRFSSSSWVCLLPETFLHIPSQADTSLAIVRLAEPIALTSIFPYAWALIKRFKVGADEDASFYAGLLISSFSLAEALMGMYWGGLSDRIGRKPVLMLGCVGTMFSMVMVGFASNLWVALIGRAVGGLLNGNIGVIQTMVGELVTKPEHEREWTLAARSKQAILIPLSSSRIRCYAFCLEYRYHHWSVYWRNLCRPLRVLA
jgi:MFS family permease